MFYNREHQNNLDLICGRGTHQGHDFLAPARQQAEIVLYDVVLKALQNGQIPTALMTTTNTLEVALIDTNGERAQYTQEAHSLIALHRNKLLGRNDHFWSCAAPDEMILLSPQAAIEALARLYCRPVELGDWCLLHGAPEETATTMAASSLVDDAPHRLAHASLPSPWLFPQVLSPYRRQEIEVGGAEAMR